jgi:hypothetical protein
MRMSPTVLILIVLLLAPLASHAAQGLSSGDARAFTALRSTHIGALTPLMTPAMVGRRLDGAQLALRYGLRNEDDFRTQAVAASGIFALGLRSTVALSAGVVDADCFNCSPALLLGLGGDARVYEGGDPMGTGTSLSVALSGDVGYAQIKPGDDDAFAIGIGAPVTVSLATGGRESMHVVPYFTPVFGIGSTNAPCGVLGDCTKNGTRWVIGGGLGVWNPLTSVSASVGVNQVMLSGAKPVFGINVIFGGR